MSYELLLVLSYTIAPAAGAAVWRWKQAETSYYPLLVLLPLGFVNELSSSLMIRQGFSNVINSNIFLLAEALLLIMQFKRWGLFAQRQKLYRLTVAVMVVLWGFENYSWYKFSDFSPVFTIVSSAIIVLMSIFNINLLVIHYPGALMRSAAFLFCCGFCCYFSTMLLLEVFLTYGAGLSIELQAAAFKASCIINGICNFLYLIAVIWIPQKPRYIMS